MQSVALRPREARRKSPPALRTLVLNADYRPLLDLPAQHHRRPGRGICDLARAGRRCRGLAGRILPLAIDHNRCGPLPEPALAAVLRILSKPVDEPITK